MNFPISHNNINKEPDAQELWKEFSRIFEESAEHRNKVSARYDGAKVHDRLVPSWVKRHEEQFLIEQENIY